MRIAQPGEVSEDPAGLNLGLDVVALDELLDLAEDGRVLSLLHAKKFCSNLLDL